MSEKVEKHLRLSDLTEQPEAAPEATQNQAADPKEIDHCFNFLQAGQFAEATKREARGTFSKLAFIAALQRKRMMDASKSDE